MKQALFSFFLLVSTYPLFCQNPEITNINDCSDLNWLMDKLVNDRRVILGEKKSSSFDFNDDSYYYESKVTFRELEGKYFEEPNPYKTKKLEFQGRYELSQRAEVDEMALEILKDALGCLGDEFIQTKLASEYPINVLVYEASDTALLSDKKKFHLIVQTEIFNDDYFLTVSFFQPYVKKK